MQFPEPNKEFLQWLDIENAVISVVKAMERAEYNPLVILGVGRGGMIPAAMVGYVHGRVHNLFPEVECVYAWSYMQDSTHKTPGGIKIDWPAPEIIEGWVGLGENLLIVDDLTDTGETLEAYKGKFPLAKTATLIHKKSSTLTPDFYGREDTEGLWYVFPWE